MNIFVEGSHNKRHVTVMQDAHQCMPRKENLTEAECDAFVKQFDGVTFKNIYRTDDKPVKKSKRKRKNK